MKYEWASFSDIGALMVAAVLALIVAGLVVAAVRLRSPIAVPPIPGTVVVVLVVAWLLSIADFLVSLVSYGLQAQEEHFALPSSPNRVTPVTLACAGIVFGVVMIATRVRVITRLGNAVMAACVGPMIFELPFDVIVMTRTSAIPPAPGLYIALFFLPLFLVELLTIVLAITRPGVRITRWTVVLLAAMFGVFTVWAASGFHYPAGGLPLALNVISKVFAFAVAVSFFVPWPRPTIRASTVNRSGPVQRSLAAR